MIAAVAPALVAPAPAFAAALPRISNLLVYATEWHLTLSRGTVPAGTVDVTLWNRGQDGHDLAVRRLGADGSMTGPVLGQVAAAASGARVPGVWHLRAGRYEVYCALPGHLDMGMHAVLVVRR